MYVTKAILEKRLGSDRNVAHSLFSPEPEKRHQESQPEVHEAEIVELGTKPGSRRGIQNLDPETRVEIAAYARMYGPKAAAEKFGVSYSRAESLNRGVVSFGLGTPQELKDGVNKRLEPIRESAIAKVIAAMGLITEEKLDEVKPRDLADIAVKMMKVVEKTSPRTMEFEGASKVVFYTPETAKDTDFPEIIVQAVPA